MRYMTWTLFIQLNCLLFFTAILIMIIIQSVRNSRR